MEKLSKNRLVAHSFSQKQIFVDRVLYARKGGEDVQSQAVNLGGDKISVEEATVSVLHYVMHQNWHIFLTILCFSSLSLLCSFL